MFSDIAARLQFSARGRPVEVMAARNTLLTRDFAVRYDGGSGGYVVELTSDGHLEEALRFVERWIARDAQNRDGVYQPPPDHYVDLIDEPMYWLLERQADQLFADLEQAIARYRAYVENELYDAPRLGDVVIEQRVAALVGLASHFDVARAEVRQAVLSPHTVAVLRSAGILPDPAAPEIVPPAI